jgi:inorganic pyrophosphatase
MFMMFVLCFYAFSHKQVMEDEKGLDEKVLAVCSKDPRYEEVKTLRDLPEHTLREIAHFFETYKSLEKKKWVKIGGWKGTEDTLALIEETHRTYLRAKAEGKIEYAGN